MKYMGSKARIAKHILPIMLKEAENRGITTWVEPFVGGANMIDKVPSTFERVGCDYNTYLIEMFKELQKGWIPNYFTKEDYTYIRDNRDISPHVTGWIGFNCSYSGKWFGGYAGKVNTKQGLRDYQDEAKRNTLRQVQSLVNVDFKNCSYEELNPVNCIIYCDPPYANTTEYKDKGFDHEKFYDWCREQAKRNVVFVSEYDAPDDFECVWQQEVKSSLSANGVSGGNKVSIEKLFRVHPL